MTDEGRDKLLRRMAAHQYRMGRLLLDLARTAGQKTTEESADELGRQSHDLSRAIEEIEP